MINIKMKSYVLADSFKEYKRNLHPGMSIFRPLRSLYIKDIFTCE